MVWLLELHLHQLQYYDLKVLLIEAPYMAIIVWIDPAFHMSKVCMQQFSKAKVLTCQCN